VKFYQYSQILRTRLKTRRYFFKKYSGLMEGVFVLLTVAAAAFGTVMIAANFPVILLTALILALGAAFVIAYDDIKAFLNGSDSLIGQAIQKWPVLGGIVKFIGAVIKDTWELLKLLGNSVINQWQAIIGFFKASMGFILNIVEKISNAYAKAKSFLGFADQEKELNISMAKQSLITANAFPGAMGASGALNRFNNKNLSVSTGPITIQTQASDADGISNAIGQSLNTQLRQAVNNFDDGVMI
jgi:hypothetical protein